jgi:hypothetical protein
MTELKNSQSPAEFLKAIDKADDDLMSLRSSYMSSCKGPRGAIKATMSQAREAGINMTAFRELLTQHREERRQDRRLGELEADDIAAFEEMVEALGEFGDTPLGDAALRKAKPRGEESLDGLNG